MKEKILLFFILLLLHVFSYANGMNLTDALQDKSVSLADLFVCKLQGRIKCEQREAVSGICSNSVKFDEQNKIFTITVNLNDINPLLSKFVTSNEDNKESILKSIIEDIAIHLGVSALPDTGGQFKFGEIQKIDISSVNNINSDDLKEHIANNTIIELFVRHNGSIYWVLRGVDHKKEVVVLDQEKFDEKFKEIKGSGSLK